MYLHYDIDVQADVYGSAAATSRVKINELKECTFIYQNYNGGSMENIVTFFLDQYGKKFGAGGIPGAGGVGMVRDGKVLKNVSELKDKDDVFMFVKVSEARSSSSRIRIRIRSRSGSGSHSR